MAVTEPEKILVVIDMQKDFIDGSLGTPEAEAIVERVADKIRTYDSEHVYATRDTHLDDYLETQEGQKAAYDQASVETEIPEQRSGSCGRIR